MPTSINSFADNAYYGPELPVADVKPGSSTNPPVTSTPSTLSTPDTSATPAQPARRFAGLPSEVLLAQGRMSMNLRRAAEAANSGQQTQTVAVVPPRSEPTTTQAQDTLPSVVPTKTTPANSPQAQAPTQPTPTPSTPTTEKAQTPNAAELSPMEAQAIAQKLAAGAEELSKDKGKLLETLQKVFDAANKQVSRLDIEALKTGDQQLGKLLKSMESLKTQSDQLGPQSPSARTISEFLVNELKVTQELQGVVQQAIREATAAQTPTPSPSRSK